VALDERAPPAPVDGPVGAFIDALMAERRADVQVQPDGVTEYLPLGAGEAIALSADERGRMRWTALEAVTRHPVVNRDGSSTLMRVTLRSGRSVDVTRAKSILVVRDGRVVAIDGDELRVGDAVPVMHGCAKPAQDLDDEDDTHVLCDVDIRTLLLGRVRLDDVDRRAPLPGSVRRCRSPDARVWLLCRRLLADGHATDHEVHI
jgi:hypothetical protein